MQEAGQGSGEPVEHHLCLRVAEPRVELHDLDAGRRQGEARVQQAAIRGGAAAQRVDRGLDDPLEDVAGQIRRGPGERRVGAHATRVGALVAVAGPLEVLRREQRDRGRAVGEREQGHLGTVQVLLDDDLAAARGVAFGDAEVVGDDDARAGRQRVVLDHVGRPEGAEGLVGLGLGGGRQGPGRGDAGLRHDLLGERLRPFNACGRRVRAEGGNSRCAERVADTGHQRGLRSDHHEVGAQRLGQPGDLSRVGDLHLVRLRQLGDARIARRGMQIRHRGVAAEGADDRVLTAAGPDHQYSHVGEPTVRYLHIPASTLSTARVGG